MEFPQWLNANVPGLRFFEPSEFLFKGGAHSKPGAKGFGLNTDPPQSLWPNVLPLVKLLEQFRAFLGVPVRLSSIYRSPAYNAAISGAGASQHMMFKAADITAGVGGPADWAATLREMRAKGYFTGAIGTYDTFVHVDVRSGNVDFEMRKGPKPAGRVLVAIPSKAPSASPAPPSATGATAGGTTAPAGPAPSQAPAVPKSEMTRSQRFWAGLWSILGFKQETQS